MTTIAEFSRIVFDVGAVLLVAGVVMALAKMRRTR